MMVFNSRKQNTTGGGPHTHTHTRNENPREQQDNHIQCKYQSPTTLKQIHIPYYPPYILSHLLKCFFSPVVTPNAPSHVHTHTHTHTLWKPEATKTPLRTTTPKRTHKTSNILTHKPCTPNPIEYHRQHNLLSQPQTTTTPNTYP